MNLQELDDRIDSLLVGIMTCDDSELDQHVRALTQQVEQREPESEDA